MSSIPEPSARATSQLDASRRRLVTDAPTRAFHWLFASSFVGAWLTADGEHWRALHEALGYTLAGLLVFRLAYGLLGPRHARLRPLLQRLVRMPAWLRAVAGAVRRGTLAGVAWNDGRNAAMALMVAALLFLAIPVTLSGYGLAGAWADSPGDEWLAGLHETAADAMLGLALGHVALIAGLSLLRRRNAALAMLTGRVHGTGPDLVRDNRGRLAALLVMAVLAFLAWQWRQSPDGLVPAPELGSPAAERDRDGDD